MADFDIQMKLTMLDEASKQVKSVIDAMSSLGKNAEEINKRFSAMNESFDKFASAATGSGTRFERATSKAANSARKAATDIAEAHSKMATETAKSIGRVSAATTRMVQAAASAEQKIINAVNNVTTAGVNAVNKSIQALTRLNAAQSRVAQAAVDNVNRINAASSRASAATTRYATRINTQMGQFGANATAAQGRIATGTNRMATAATRAAQRIETAQNAIAFATGNVVLGTAQGTRGLNNMALAARNLRNSLRGVDSSLKSMAELWGALKIEHFGKGAYHDASNFQQGYMQLRGQGLSDTEAKNEMRNSLNTPDRIRYVSPQEAIDARVGAIGGVAHYNPGMINATVDHATRNAKNLQAMYPDIGDLKDVVRNLYGIAEMRMQTNDPAAMMKTFDLAMQAVEATGGKIKIGDIETMMRQMKLGASTISDDGLRNLIALADQAKVSGGDAGGGRGVATVGTAYNTLQAYAAGRRMPHRAEQLLIGAGMVDRGTVGMAGVKTSEQRHGPFKDAEMVSTNMVGWVQKFAPNIVAYIKAHKGEFAPKDANLNDQKTMEAAIQSWAAQTGMASTAVGLISAAASPRSGARIQQQAHQSKSAPTSDALDKLQEGTSANNVQEFTAAWNRLKIVLGAELLPVVTLVVKAVTNLVNTLAVLFQGSSSTAWAAIITTAFLGVKLAVAGVKGMFGLLGPVLKLVGVRSLGMSTVFGGAMAAVRGRLLGSLIAANTFGGGVGRMATGVASAGSKIFAAFSLVGKGILRIIPFFGQLLLAWDMAELLANIKVGGVKISTWIIGWLDTLTTKLHTWWNSVLSIFKDTAGAAALAADSKAHEAELDKRLKANGMKRKGMSLSSTQDDKKAPPLPEHTLPPNHKSVPGRASATSGDPSDAYFKKLQGGGTGLGPDVHFGNQKKGAKRHQYNEQADDLKNQFQQEQHELQLQLRLLTDEYKKGEIGIKEYYDRKEALIRAGTSKELGALYKERDALAKHSDATSKSMMKHVQTQIREKEMDRQEQLDQAAIDRKADMRKLDEARFDLDSKIAGVEGKTKQARLYELQKELELKRQLFIANKDQASLDKLDQYKKQATAGINFDVDKQKVLDIQSKEKSAINEVTAAVKRGDMTTLDGENQKYSIRQKAATQIASMIQEMKELAIASGDPRLIRWAQELEATNRSVQAELPPIVQTIHDSMEKGLSNFFDKIAKKPKDIKAAFLDLCQSIEQSITQLISKNLSEQLMKSLFGDTSGGSGGTGFAGMLSKLFGGSGGTGSVMDDASTADAFDMSLPAYDVGTANVPSDMIAQIHAGETIVPRSMADGIRSGDLTLGRGSSSNMNVQNHFHITGGADQRTQNQIATAAALSLQRAFMRNS